MNPNIRSLSQWRQTPSLISKANKALNDEVIQEMLRVMENELPTNQSLPLTGTDTNAFVYAYGCEIGYRNFLAKFRAFAQPLPKQEDVEASFSEKNDD